MATLFLVVNIYTKIQKGGSYIKQSRRVAFGGVITSLSILLMFLSSLIPIATYSIPALTGFLILILLIEFDRRTACTCYVSVCFLSLIVVANKEAVLIYSFIFGQYPIIKSIIEKRTNWILNYFTKIFYFNFNVIFAYYLALNIFGFNELVNEFQDIAFIGYISLLVLGNVSFVLYDYTLTAIVPYYFVKIKPLLKL